jgi:hypothetical protein
MISVHPFQVRSTLLILSIGSGLVILATLSITKHPKRIFRESKSPTSQQTPDFVATNQPSFASPSVPTFAVSEANTLDQTQEQQVPAVALQKKTDEDPVVKVESHGSAVDTESSTRNLQTKITKAISARAIHGINVTVTNNMAILTGVVQTESQKAAAEQAARNVAGVRSVRSAVRVEWPNGEG